MWFVYSFNLQSGAVTCYVLKCYFIAFEQCLSLKRFFQNNNECSKLPWCCIQYKYCCNYRSHLRYGKWGVHSWKQYWESTEISWLIIENNQIDPPDWSLIIIGENDVYDWPGTQNFSGGGSNCLSFFNFETIERTSEKFFKYAYLPVRFFSHNYHLNIFGNLLIMMSFKGFDGSWLSSMIDPPLQPT